jgi:peptidoglycan/xylan/chitin deacetylase (PgdA/CDA1 family)
VLARFKSSAERDPDRLLTAIREQAGITLSHQPTRFMNWSEIRELSQHGMEIGSHTMSHPMLSRLSEEEQLDEFVASKAEIETHIGTTVRAIAYPFGSRDAFNETTRQLVAEAGYETAFSFYGGMNPAFDSEVTSLRRMRPWTWTNVEPFNVELNLLTRFGATISNLADCKGRPSAANPKGAFTHHAAAP